ncbi:reticulon-1 isoform X2 [Drosophila virilis]|uniref:Reticulon-like protein n=1 Tax=Drosophila virilis TaxID=7244 RepID=A0A0Q9WKG8_DROVI|nr:reticulon-1 isoform X2 [Drosophila virilis]KRF81339.1 uncharacterized protein Dvir_GJ17140, isoform D [Drosophila virilis]
MDFNFADLKKEAAATADDIFSSATSAANAASKKVANTYDDLLGDLSAGDSAGSSGSAANVSSGAQDDNAHTEKYFANEQKNLDFGDPQAFVQRMSAGAKEAQEQLDAKFAQQTDDFGDFMAQAGKAAKHGIGELTSDFMNVERGLYGDAPKPADPPAAVPAVAPAVPAAPPAVVPAAAPAVPAPPKPATEPEVDLMGGFSQPMSAPLQPFAATAPTASDKFYDDDDDDYFSKPNPAAAAAVATATAAAAAVPAPVVANKDSDTDSPSASYTPSPAKKAIADALKEQDHEKFISSEDLLSDFKEERTATPPVAPTAAAAAAATAPAPTPIPASATAPASALVTDLDDEEIAVKPTPKPEPVKPVAKPVEPPKVKAPAQQPQKQQQQQQQQPKIVSVEEIFYKYGLVESLIYWRDVKKSGIVFGAGLITLVAISSFSVISVFAYLSLLALVGTVAFRVYKSVTQAVQKTNDGHPFKEYLELDLTLSQEKVQHFAGVAVAHINGFVAELRRLFLVEDIIDSIKFGVILWVFTYIGAWFNGMTLVILAFVSLFTLPKVYENNKQSIDTYLDLVRNKLTEITDKIRVALPIGNKKPVAAAAAESDKDK